MKQSTKRPSRAPERPPQRDARFKPTLAAAGLRTFFRIADKWALSSEQQAQLLAMPRSTFFKAKLTPDAVGVNAGTLERLSYVLGIYKALHILLPNAQAADTWIHRPNAAPPFNGAAAVERMLGGNIGDLYAVRQYLDGQRGC